jgi:hypothetical protein
VAVAPGTPLLNGHLFGSHIFQTLGLFGKTLGQSDLLKTAIGAFVDASGVMPTARERQILEDIVARFLRTGGSGKPDTTPNPVNPGPNANNGANGATDVVRIIVTVEVPRGAHVVGVQTQPAGQDAQPGGTGENVSPAPTITPPTGPGAAPAAQQPQKPEASAPEAEAPK